MFTLKAVQMRVQKNSLQRQFNFDKPSSLLGITQDIVSCLDQLELLRRLLCIVQVFVWRPEGNHRFRYYGNLDWGLTN